TLSPPFSTATATTSTYTLSLHDALPICSLQFQIRPIQIFVISDIKNRIHYHTQSIHCRCILLLHQVRYELNKLPALYHHTMTERSEEHTSELQSRFDLVCRLLLEKKNKI